LVRVYLSGQMLVEAGRGVAWPRDFPGQQGREAFAFLAVHHRQAVPRHRLAETLWRDGLPPSWDAALSAVLSKLRRTLSRIGLDGGETIRTAAGCYELRLPAEAWIDHQIAVEHIHQSEAALSRADYGSVYGPSAVARCIAERPFLTGSEGEWIELRRDKLRSVLIRALECRCEFYLWNGEHTLAVEAARSAVQRAPFRESAYRLLMRAHAAAGNSAEALRVYERCRGLISDELGVAPSSETRQVRADLLRAL
jgi:DNA-binding SARP family transcriptional activator